MVVKLKKNWRFDFQANPPITKL